MTRTSEPVHVRELAHELAEVCYRLHLDGDGDGDLAQRLQDRALQLESAQPDPQRMVAIRVVGMLERYLELTPRGHPNTATRRMHLALTLQDIYVSHGSLDILLSASEHTRQACLEVYNAEIADLLLDELHLYFDNWSRMLGSHSGNARDAILTELLALPEAVHLLQHVKQAL